MHNNIYMTTIDGGISLKKRSSVEISRTKTKKMYEKYNMQKDFDSSKNNKNIFLPYQKILPILN